MDSDVIVQHLAYGAIISYVMEFLKNSRFFPWLTQNSDKLNRAVSFLASLLSSIGIQAAATGHLTFTTGTVITLTVPNLTVVVNTILHAVGQFVIQQGVYKGLIKTNGQTTEPVIK